MRAGLSWEEVPAPQAIHRGDHCIVAGTLIAKVRDHGTVSGVGVLHGFRHALLFEPYAGVLSIDQISNPLVGGLGAVRDVKGQDSGTEGL